LPVITGIGHDKDDTVVDLVAHTRMKTPTAVAEFLIAGALRFSQELKELEQQFIELITDQLDSKKSRLSEIAGQLNVLVNKMIVAQQNRLEITGIQLSNHSQSYLKVQQSDIRQKLVETKNRTERFVAKQNHRLDYSGNKLNYSFREQTLKNKNLLNRFEHLIRIQALEIIRSEKKNLNAVAEKLRLVDPMNVLKRGYSLTMVEGKILKSVKQISIGDKLETRMSDGTIESTIEKISNKE
jgi:exodeoxyribonuclease VII large subunit